jgi:hypothetical protein
MICPCCELEVERVTRSRQRTQYVYDEHNFFTGCDDCHDANNEHWDDMWSEYYQGCM